MNLLLTFYNLISCLDDVDDEVRDRATLYLKFMENGDLAKQYIQEGKKEKRRKERKKLYKKVKNKKTIKINNTYIYIIIIKI